MSIRNIIFITILSSLFILLVLFVFKYQKFSSGEIGDYKAILTELNNGDLIFRKGRSLESFIVCLADEEKEFSHVGLVVLRKGIPFVIHAVPGESDVAEDFIKLERVEAFLSTEKAAAFAVYRPGFEAEIRNRASEIALQFYQSKCTFDNAYDMKTESKLYCTELIFKAFREAGVELSGIHPSTVDFGFVQKQIILPAAFLKNPSFTRINYN
jgi:hypothetical protein